jgi:hypothetical protein
MARLSSECLTLSQSVSHSVCFPPDLNRNCVDHFDLWWSLPIPFLRVPGRLACRSAPLPSSRGQLLGQPRFQSVSSEIPSLRMSPATGCCNKQPLASIHDRTPAPLEVCCFQSQSLTVVPDQPLLLLLSATLSVYKRLCSHAHMLALPQTGVIKTTNFCKPWKAVQTRRKLDSNLRRQLNTIRRTNSNQLQTI